MPCEYYVGLMSGTSLDGIDAALVDLATPHAPRLVAAATTPYEETLRRHLLQLCQRQTASIAELLSLDVQVGRALAHAARVLLDEAGLPAHAVRAIGSHGQTIRHQPSADPPATLQIGDPNIIAEATGITTVADFRRRDMAAGGEGAPLVPAFHQAVFGSGGESRIVLNIGGIANITVLGAGDGAPLGGFDTGPGNTLMDAWALRHLGRPLDERGRWAASGSVNQALLAQCLADPYFQRPPPKSSGREYFSLQWLEDKLRECGTTPTPADVQATLCELSARSMAEAVLTHAPGTRRILICGGGLHNDQLVERLRALLGAHRLGSTAEVGIDPDMVEAMAFAWLAQRTLHGQPGNAPGVTGARREVILGGIYQGGHQ